MSRMHASSDKKFNLIGKLNQTSQNSIQVNSSIDTSNMTVRKKPFVPLRDLLQKNHDDRVQDYLEKMKGLNLEEIVNSTS